MPGSSCGAILLPAHLFRCTCGTESVRSAPEHIGVQALCVPARRFRVSAGACSGCPCPRSSGSYAATKILRLIRPCGGILLHLVPGACSKQNGPRLFQMELPAPPLNVTSAAEGPITKQNLLQNESSPLRFQSDSCEAKARNVLPWQAAGFWE